MRGSSSQAKVDMDLKQVIRRWCLGTILLAIGVTLVLLFFSFYAETKRTERQPDFYTHNDSKHWDDFHVNNLS